VLPRRCDCCSCFTVTSIPAPFQHEMLIQYNCRHNHPHGTRNCVQTLPRHKSGVSTRRCDAAVLLARVPAKNAHALRQRVACAKPMPWKAPCFATAIPALHKGAQQVRAPRSKHSQHASMAAMVVVVQNQAKCFTIPPEYRTLQEPQQQLQPSATTAGAGDAIYVLSAKTGARLVKQQQAALDANATYAAPMRRVPEQDYVASSEMLRNEKACLMYDLPTASATTSIDVGTAVLQCQSQPKLVLEWCCWGQRPRGWMATGMVRESKKRRRRRRGGAPHQGSVYLGFAADNEESMP